MKVVMLGTPICHKCRSIRPVVEEHCAKKGIEFFYSHIQDADPEIMDIIQRNKVRQAPAFLIYKESNEVVVLSGDAIFMELNSL